MDANELRATYQASVEPALPETLLKQMAKLVLSAVDELRGGTPGGACLALREELGRIERHLEGDSGSGEGLRAGQPPEDDHMNSGPGAPAWPDPPAR
ncbi:MAG: hypothetical protein Q8N53_12675, partial [Longimicrobiales bacterium]|nr:hypothetical protein [Longimicrobiales bacterium]